MGDDISKGTTYATGGGGGQGVITSSNLNAHVDDAVIKPTFISAKTERIPGDLADSMLLESSGALHRMLLSTLQVLLVTPATAPAGSILQTVVATPYTANANLAVIPGDDTIPQITEGTQILTVTITPAFTASRIRLIFSGFGAVDALGVISAALFRVGNVNAILSTQASVASVSQRACLSMDWVDSPVTTSAVTYTVRAGAGAGVGRMNGTNAARVFGGVAACTLVAQEIR